MWQFKNLQHTSIIRFGLWLVLLKQKLLDSPLNYFYIFGKWNDGAFGGQHFVRVVSIPCPWQLYSLKPSKESGTRQINKWLNWKARSAGKYSEPKQHLPSKLKFDTGHNFKMREMRFFKLSSSVLYQQGHNDIHGHTKTVKLCPLHHFWTLTHTSPGALKWDGATFF